MDGHDHLTALLGRLKLGAMRDQLDSLIDEAGRRELTIREALTMFCEREVARRDQRRIDMAFGLARFPFARDLAGFDFGAQPSLDKAQIREIGYLPVVPGGGNLFFQLVNARYERGAMILTSNRGFAEWGDIFGDPVVATALLDRLLHHAVVIQIEGASYRLRQHADLVPEHVRSKALITPPPAMKRRGRPPGKANADHHPG